MRNNKIKFVHPSFEYVEGHEDEITLRPFKNKRGWTEVEASIEVAGSMVVCPSCGGYGVHERRDIDCSKIVDSYLEDGDYEGLESYHNGAFDVTCTHCKGKNVVLEPNWDALPVWARNAVESWERSARESAAIEAAERACGA